MASIAFSGLRSGLWWDSPYQWGWADWKEWTAQFGNGEYYQLAMREGPGGYNYKGLCVYKMTYSLSGVRSIAGLTIKTRFNSLGPTAYTARCYLYTSDPTGTDSPTPPAGYIAMQSASVVGSVGDSGVYLETTFTFTGLSVSSGSQLYAMFETSMPDAYYQGTAIYVDPSVATAVFKGIPTSFSVSPSTVGTGGAVSVNIGNFWTTETVQFYSGSTLLGTSTITNGSGSVSIPKSWFTTAGITTAQTMTVQARLVGTSFAQNFTVQAGSDMKPTVGTPAVTLVQDPAASDFPNTFIANISKAKVRATVSAGSNAEVYPVTLSWSEGNKEMNLVSGAYEATVGPMAGDTVFTVTATDARGMTSQATCSLTGVVQYAPPLITILDAGTYRCDSGGAAQDGGEYVRARAAAQISTSGLPENAVKSYRFYIQEEPGKGDDLSYNQQEDYWECGQTPGRSADYYETLVFELSDKIQTVTRSVRLQPATRNFAMRRSADGTYVGIGVLPQHTSGESTVDIEEGGGYYEGGYLWGSLTRLNSAATDGSQFSKNFMNVDTSLLHAPQNAEAFFIKSSDSGWSNSPVSGVFGGLRKVIWIDGSHYFIIILEAAPTAGRIWISYNGGTWKSMTPA